LTLADDKIIRGNFGAKEGSPGTTTFATVTGEVPSEAPDRFASDNLRPVSDGRLSFEDTEMLHCIGQDASAWGFARPQRPIDRARALAVLEMARACVAALEELLNDGGDAA
jgi:hypothetical protein